MFAVAQAPPDHAHRLRTQRNRRTSFCGRRSRCGADLIAAIGDRCPVGATADGSRADDGRCCIPASGPLAGPRGRRCSSVEGAYPNAGGAVPLEDPLTGQRSDSVIGGGPDRGLCPAYREWPAIASGPVTPGEVPPTAHLVTAVRGPVLRRMSLADLRCLRDRGPACAGRACGLCLGRYGRPASGACARAVSVRLVPGIVRAKSAPNAAAGLTAPCGARVRVSSTARMLAAAVKA
jgi:hypothetical protein